MGGARIVTMVNSMIDEDNNIDTWNFMRGFDHAMRPDNYTWFDRCQVFALHSRSFDDGVCSYADTSGSSYCTSQPSLREMFEDCVNNGEINNWMTTDPPANFNQPTDTCQVCPPGYLSSGQQCYPNLKLPPCDNNTVYIAMGPNTGLCLDCGVDHAYNDECIRCPEDRPYYMEGDGYCVARCEDHLWWETKVDPATGRTYCHNILY